MKMDRDQKAFVLTDEESNMFEIKKGTKKENLLSSLLFNMVLHKALEDDISAGNRKKRMEIYLSDNDHDCLTSLRLPTTCSCLRPPKHRQLQKMLCESRKVLNKWNSGFIQKKTKILINQSSDPQEMEVDDRGRNTDKRRNRETLGPDDYVFATGDGGNQKSNQGCLGDILQVQAGIDIEKRHVSTIDTSYSTQ